MSGGIDIDSPKTVLVGRELVNDVGALVIVYTWLPPAAPGPRRAPRVPRASPPEIAISASPAKLMGYCLPNAEILLPYALGVGRVR